MPSRNWLLFKRRGLRVKRLFSVLYLGDRKTQYTCRTCGDVTVKTASPFSSEPLLKKLADYQNNVGATGICRKCTAKERDIRFPLHEAKEKE